MNKTDKAIHQLYDDIKEIRFNDFLSLGADEHYFDWYYAESGLYIIRDVMIDALYFIEARSPVKALEQLKSRLDEAVKSGSYCPEDYEYD